MTAVSPLRVAVLGASGGTGRQLVEQALSRGHQVTALVRNPATATFTSAPMLTVVAADATDPAIITRALTDVDVLVSGLGVAKKEKAGVLTTGAQGVVAAAPIRIVWLGAFGTGGSAGVAGGLFAAMIKVFLRSQIADKQSADQVVLPAGATVFHAGPLADGPVSAAGRTVPVATFTRQGLVPKKISRATVAAQMLDEAENNRYSGQIVVPLS